MWTPQILLDSYKNTNNRQRTTQISNKNSFKLQPNENDETWVVHTPTNINEVKIFNKNSNWGSRLIQDNIIKSDLQNQENKNNDLKKWRKPGFQSNANQINSWTSAFSHRDGNKTAKNKDRQYSTETFDEFVVRINQQNKKIPESLIKAKTRPSTSGGYGQLRIKQPGSKSGMGIKMYDEVQKYPYFKYNRQNTQKDVSANANAESTDYSSSQMLREKDSNTMNNRRTLFPNSKELLTNNTITASQRATEYRK